MSHHADASALLPEIEARQDEVLDQLTQLNARIEQLLKEHLQQRDPAAEVSAEAA